MKSTILQCLFLHFFNSVQLYRKKVSFLQVLLLKNSFMPARPYIYVVDPLLLFYDFFLSSHLIRTSKIQQNRIDYSIEIPYNKNMLLIAANSGTHKKEMQEHEISQNHHKPTGD